MDEKWRDYYSETELKDIQRILLGNVKELSRVCRILGVQWMLYGGTLLGAIKYNGFVPWDDDFDVCMYRDDYDRFIKEAPKIVDSKYEIQHPFITPQAAFPYIKFRRVDTSIVSYDTRRLSINQGIYLDIYPLDRLPEDEKERAREHNRFSIVSRIFSIRQTPDLSVPLRKPSIFLKMLIRKIIRIGLLFIPSKVIYRELDRIETHYNSSSSLLFGNYFFPKPDNYFVIEGIDYCEKGVFEGLEVFLPSGYAVNLWNRYGDISLDPPEQERVGHKPVKLILNNYSEDKNEF
jgi:lipopolysaccharide cholinephosphotransferase